MTKEDKQIIDRAVKESWRIGDRTRLKHLLEKNLEQYRENVELENENEQLKQQIEKMKCGQNCKHLYINLCDLNFRTCSNCKDKWEIKEND